MNPRKLEHRFRMIHAGIPYFKGRRLMMFQLSGFYCNLFGVLYSLYSRSPKVGNPIASILKSNA